MKASIYTNYGRPEVLTFKEIEKPIPKKNEVLIRVFTTSVNRTDSGFLTGKPYIARLFSGLLKPRNKVLGNEFAGVVEDLGHEVKSYTLGDRVFGYNEVSFGAHAEFIIMSEAGPFTQMSAQMNFEDAAALTEGIHYAMCDLKAAKLQAGQHILINGSTGAIGSAAVQLSKYLGAKVTAVCDTKNIELVRSLGADTVIDYTQQDFTNLYKDEFNLIFDAVGKSSYGKCKPLLTEHGIYVSTELGHRSQNVFLALWTPFFSKKKVIFPIPTISKEDVIFFRTLFEEGKFKPVIDRVYPFEKIKEAFEYVLSGQKIGNVMIKIIQ